MNILIRLSNNLLEMALRELLACEPEGYRVAISSELQEIGGFDPEFIITDSHSLRKSGSSHDPASKTVLLDCGLGEEEIASLLISHKIEGVLAANTDMSLFKKALHAMSEGQVWIDNRKIKALIQHAECTKYPNPEEGFSRKEREIIILVSQGLLNREIASRLCISEQTVKTHISRIFRKAQVNRRSQLVPLALKLTVPTTV